MQPCDIPSTDNLLLIAAWWCNHCIVGIFYQESCHQIWQCIVLWYIEFHQIDFNQSINAKVPLNNLQHSELWRSLLTLGYVLLRDLYPHALYIPVSYCQLLFTYLFCCTSMLTASTLVTGSFCLIRSDTCTWKQHLHSREHHNDSIEIKCLPNFQALWREQMRLGGCQLFAKMLHCGRQK